MADSREEEKVSSSMKKPKGPTVWKQFGYWWFKIKGKVWGPYLSQELAESVREAALNDALPKV